MTSSDNLYFIITENPQSPAHIKAGRICYISNSTYSSRLSYNDSPSYLTVVPYGSQTLQYFPINLSCIEALSAEESGLLLALSDDAERLKWYRERAALQTARELREGTLVVVQEGAEELTGVIRYIGNLTEPKYPNPLTGTYFGIELLGVDRGKGKKDGTYQYRHLLNCSKDCGIFAPFSRVRPLVPRSLSPSVPETSLSQRNVGDRVIYVINGTCRYGMVLGVEEENGKYFVRISTETDENGKTGGEVSVPIECTIKGEVSEEPQSMDTDMLPVKPNNNDLGLSVNSMVEVTLAKGNSYGTIRWIGTVKDSEKTMAGLELEEDWGVSDGTFKEERFFTCPPKRALFVRLSSLRPDSRFLPNNSEGMPKQQNTESETDQTLGMLETVPPITPEQVKLILIGRMKGIQGHCNSCYMDAALFSLFSCSSVLDSMLFKSTSPQDAPIQNTLLTDIVNPLRSSAHGKVQDSYCYQIFLDQTHSLVLPTVQQLLEHSFHSAELKLAEVPSCLILQMPRFGKKFKMFDKIVPSLELDITDLLTEGPQQCILCGELALKQCTDCFKDPVFSQTGFKVFCNDCSSKVHSHPQRLSHHIDDLNVPKGYQYHGKSHTQMMRDKMELFAVLCIETSHYVSFVKYGPESEDWIFFDSMADRQGERDGFNIPEVLACPEVGAYLKMSPAELANQVPRDMKGVARRLFCDAYMYLYQSNSMCLYR
ncbi:ubiquitin carboxyl-terminal hydrolase CYLD isoform X2 [Echeneis naucrates]|uniref:ubiquitin carboxyl-terminal hydrolase CYLD isoform X2 n=1 Tax=Echeneis naucrates TaxID=173247 RepID=UPI001113A0E1|nr:ubiquitin carboxyl-terminal hydrolase CYLD-like isoform X2 [Echeneis naucrates]